MDISEQDAKESLEQVAAVHSQTIKTIASTYASGLLMIWGLVCMIAYLGTHFFLARANYIWMVSNGLGGLATFLLVRRQFREAKPTKIPESEKIGWRVFWFWMLLGVYIFVWLSLVSPISGLQMNAFIMTAVMFAYVVIGLWNAGSLFMVWLGLAVTCATLVGFYAIGPEYYCLWMAATAGGGLFGTGLYIRVRWG
jgi:hypothetical protein